MQNKEYLKLIKKHKEDIITMLENDVFSFENGQAVIHRDKTGKLKQINYNNHIVFKC